MTQEKLNRIKPNVSNGTKGHTDNEKITLTGAINKILAYSGENANSVVDYAYIDEVPEERARGITINTSHVKYATFENTSSATSLFSGTINQSRLLEGAYMDMHLLSKNKPYVKKKH